MNEFAIQRLSSAASQPGVMSDVKRKQKSVFK